MIKATLANLDWFTEHLTQYLATNGENGHYIDMSEFGGKEGGTQTLLLRTVGRKSGKTSILPLIYGKFGDEYAVVGSNGGAPVHPAWVLNIKAGGPVAIQVIGDKSEASWRILEGEERQAVWDGMVDVYPPYTDYAKATERLIPVIMLKPVKAIEAL